MGNKHSMIDIQWAKEVEPYGDFRRVQIFYQKNNKDQNATYIEMENGWSICGEEHYPRNGLNEKEKQELAEFAKKGIRF